MTPPPALEFTLLKSTRASAGLVSPRDLEALAGFVLGAEGVRGPVELTLDLTNPRRIRALNRRFRGVDRTTDVISFRSEFVSRLASRVARPFDARPGARGARFSGDIAINLPQAKLQAAQMKHPWRREVRLLWIHGLLHLLGYTDYEPKPRRRMFRRQNELLRRWEKRTRA